MKNFKNMKKLFVILVGVLFLTSCEKKEVCVITNIKTSLQPCEGYPDTSVFVYENSYDQYVDGVKIDTLRYCSNGILIEEKVIINCNKLE